MNGADLRRSFMVGGDLRSSFMDGADLMHEFQVGELLLLGHRQRINSQPLLVAKHLQDVARGDAAERIKAVLGEVDAVSGGDLAPGQPVERHGVSKGSVAVENKAFDGQGIGVNRIE